MCLRLLNGKKLKKVAFSVAFVLFDMKIHSNLIPKNLEVQVIW